MTTMTFAILSLDDAFAAMDAIDAAAAPGADILAFMLGETDALVMPEGPAPEHMFDIRIDYLAPIGPRPACPFCDGRKVLRITDRIRGVVRTSRGGCPFCYGHGDDRHTHNPAILARVTRARGSNVYNRLAAV
jgi:hypothetical protein